VYTFPSEEIIKTCHDATPNDMYPNKHPWIVVLEEYLSEQICDEIIARGITEEAYRFPQCNAATRELEMRAHHELKPIAEVIADVNRMFWQYKLGNNWTAWMQTYRENDSYEPHLDGSIGQTRKLTAIALLTDSSYYVGGDLLFYIHPHTFHAPRLRGTVIVFPHWVIHEVKEVKAGNRQTINLGVWGPPFQ